MAEYDQFGRLSAEGIDLNNNGILDRTGSDVLTTHSYFYENTGSPGSWTDVFQTFRHLSVGVNATTLQTEIRDRLTGLGANVVSDRTILNAVGQRAEKAHHHPDIEIRWNKVDLHLSTHSKGGLTGRDFSLAREINALA